MSTRSILIVILTVTFLALLVMAVVAVNDAVNKDGGWEAVWRAMSTYGFWKIDDSWKISFGEIPVYNVLLILLLSCFGAIAFSLVAFPVVNLLIEAIRSSSSGSIGEHCSDENYEEEEADTWNPFEAVSDYFDGFFGISRIDD